MPETFEDVVSEFLPPNIWKKMTLPTRQTFENKIPSKLTRQFWPNQEKIAHRAEMQGPKDAGIAACPNANVLELTSPRFPGAIAFTTPVGFDIAFRTIREFVADFRANEKF